MRPKEQNPVQSPYVVVLGGNSVRRKATPPPDGLPRHEAKPEHQVYGVLPPLKTMAHDLEEARPILQENVPKKKWWNFEKKPKKKEDVPLAQRTESEAIPAPVLEKPKIPPRVIDVPAERDRSTTSPYRSRFMRGIAKKGYLTSKLAIELPFHAKVGMGLALLVLIVGLPVLSRFMTKPAPVTSGAIVAIGTDALVAQVGKSIELPVGETPLVVLATADDIRRLNVPDSKPGNKILIYQNAGKIVVYDAEGDKVLGVVNRSAP